MESEALRNIRTMRQVKTSLDVAGRQRIKTTGSLSKTTEEIEHLESTGRSESQTAQILAKEKARAAKFEASADRSRQKLLKSRENLARLINRNRALTDLRHQIQQERDMRKEPPSSPQLLSKPVKSNYGSLREVELKY